MKNLQLKKIKLFQNWHESEIAKIETLGRIKNFETGEIIFQSGDLREAFSIILKGEVTIYKTFENEEENFAYLREGDFFSEEALAAPQSIHTKNGRITLNSKIWSLSGQAFQEFKQKFPELGAKLLLKITEILAERLHHADNKLITLYHTGRLLSRHEKIEILAPAILETTLGVIRAQRAILALFQPHQQKILIVGAIGFAEENSLPSISLNLSNDPVLGKIYETGEDLLITKNNWTEELKRASYASQSMIGVPVKVRRRVIGAILLFDKKHEDFNINNKILLEIIAKQIASSLQEAKLAAIEEATEELKRKYFKL